MQQIKLSIPEPCHEGWNNMKPSEKGRFCSSCQKEVVDFTGMTDDELFAFFAQKTQGSVCGRTHISQLETPIAQPVVHKKKRFWYLQYAASLLLLFAKPSGAKAQVKPPVTVTPPHPIRMGTVAYVQPVEKPSYLIKGTVVDEAGEPIVSASVTVKGYSHGVATDKEGHYQLRVKQKDIIMFSAIGYESQQIVANEKDLSITTVLKSSQSILEGKIVVAGNISWNEEKPISYDVQHHKALLQVKDKTTHGPLASASITIVQTGKSKQQKTQTNKQGEYLLRKIKANESYTVIVTAKGYQTKSLLINGSDLKSGNNLKTILLEKAPIAHPLEEVVVTGIKPPAAKRHSSAIDNALLGKVSGPVVVQMAPLVPKQQLQPNPCVSSTNINNMLAGRIGGIIAQPTIVTKPKKSFLKKIFSKPGASSNTPTPINIYPNPAKINGLIVIAFETAPKGSYRLQLINGVGSLVQQQTIIVPAEAFHFQWQLGSQVAAGSYIVNVTDTGGRTRYSGTIIITQ